MSLLLASGDVNRMILVEVEELCGTCVGKPSSSVVVAVGDERSVWWAELAWIFDFIFAVTGRAYHGVVWSFPGLMLAAYLIFLCSLVFLFLFGSSLFTRLLRLLSFAALERLAPPQAYGGAQTRSAMRGHAGMSLRIPSGV